MAVQNPDIKQIVAALSKGKSGGSSKRPSKGDAAVFSALLRTAGSKKDPLGGSKNALDAKIAAILASNAPDNIKQNALKLSSSAPKEESWWEKTINVLGKPKSTVVAGISRIADPNRNFLKDIQKNVGVADVLGNQEWYQNLSPANKLIVGLGGDIALDPLTYLAGAGIVTKIGGGSGAAKLAFNAADAATAAGAADKAAELAAIGQKASKGYSTLSGAERSVVADLAAAAGKVEKGEKTGGLFLNVPGTGRIARPITGLPLKQIQILPENIASIIPSKLRGAEEFARASTLGQKAKKYIGGNETKATLINTIRRGSPTQANAAFHVLDGWNLGGARYSMYLRDVEASRTGLVDVAKKSNVNMDDITRGLGGDLAAADRVNSAVKNTVGVDNFMGQVRNFDNMVVDEAHRLAGRDFIPKTADHAPTLPGPGVKGGTPVVRRSPFEPGGFEKRVGKEGDVFEGEVLLHPTKTSYGEIIGIGDEGQIITRHVKPADVDAARAEGKKILEFGPDPKGRDVKSQRDAIARSKYGDDYQSMYNMNWEEASAAQVRGVANRLRGEVIKTHMRAKNVSKDLYEEVLTNAAREAQEIIPGLRTELNVLDMNSAMVRVARDYTSGELKNAQETFAWVLKEAQDNVEYASTQARLLSEAFGEVTPAVQKMFDDAAEAGVKVTNAELDRKLAELIQQPMAYDNPYMQSAVSAYKAMADDLAKQTDNAGEALTSATKAMDQWNARVKSLTETYETNVRLAQETEEIITRQSELLARLDEIRGTSPEPPPLRGTKGRAGEDLEGVVRRETDPLKPSKRTLKESSIVNDGQAREAVTGRLVNTREANVVADFDSLEEVVTQWIARETARVEGIVARGAGKTAEMPSAAGAAIEVRAAARTLNESLRKAKLPTIPVGTSPQNMLDQARKILTEAELLKRPDVNRKISRAAGLEIRKINRELKQIDARLKQLEEIKPRESLSKLMSERELLIESIEDLGVRIPDLTTRAANAADAEFENFQKIAEIRRNIDASRAARIQEKVDIEIAMRNEATRLRDEALAADERWRVTREQVQAADNEVMQAEMIASIEIDKAQAAVARLEAMTLQHEADLARMTRGAEKLEQKIGRLSSKENETTFARVLQDGFARLDMTTQAPDHIVDALTQMTKMSDPKEVGNALKVFDTLTSMFKSWAILTPGFHVRNFIGGMFNNYLAGVDVASYRSFLRADKIFMDALESTGSREKAFAAVGKAMGNNHMEAYKIVDSSAILKTSGQIGSTSGEIGVGTIGMTNGRGFSKLKGTVRAKGSGNIIVDNPLTRINYMGSERVERTLRGSLAYDTALKGGDEFEAIGNVYKFHFDYEDLSSIEQRYMKRISPFYTWSRRNVPLQVEMLFQKPVAYARIGYIQDNIERMSPQEDLVPAWFSEVGGFRLPFTNPTGEQLYMMPDLPPLDLRKVVNPQEWLGEINPILKVPLELQFNRQLYNKQEFREGYVPFPEAWNKLGIGAITDALGKSKIDANGQRVGRDSDMYALESFMPLLGRVRRLFPSEDKYSRRVVATWASLVFGLGFRANTESDKKGELYRRSKKVESINTDLQGMSYGGYKTLSKDIAMGRGATEGEKSPYVMAVEPKYGLPYGSAYTMPTQGRNGGQALDAALSGIKRRGASSELVDLVNRIQAGRKN
jgi:hypothetical protein